jgi:hypothetical protein
MIDLERDLMKHIKRVKDHILDQVNTYYESDCKRKLATRIERLDDSIDMRFHMNRSRVRAINEWKSKIAMPLVREAYLSRRAVTMAAFRNEPLVSVEPCGDTPTANAEKVQKLLTQNFKATNFKAKTFRRIVNYCSRYGTGVNVSAFKRYESPYMTTVRGNFGTERVWMVNPKNNCVNTDVHPLNYFQDPMCPDAEYARYRGYIERIRLSDLYSEYKAQPDNFVKGEFEKAFEAAKKNFDTNRHYYDTTNSNVSNDAVGVDRVHYYGLISINGNEESPIMYYAQMIGEFLIRFQMNPNDEGLVPLTVFNFDQRLNYWWGNVDTENVLPHENFMQLIMSMAADEGIRNLEKFIFYDAGAIDIADINNRHKTGGFIPYDGKGRPAREVFSQYQNSNTNSLNGLQYLMQEMKESAQRVRPKSDLSRQGLPGGPRNDTATAAMMLDEQGDILESDLLENFQGGIINLAGCNVVLLRQYLPSEFQLRPDPKQSAIMVQKEELLGTYDYKYGSALNRNKQIQAQNLLNWLTFIQNMRGTGDPSWLNVNMPALVKSLFRKIDIGINEDEAYPPMDQMQQQAAPQMQGPQGMAPPPELMEQMQAGDGYA